MINKVSSKLTTSRRFQIYDYYVANGIVLLTYCFTEAVAIAWVYGINK